MLQYIGNDTYEIEVASGRIEVTKDEITQMFLELEKHENSVHRSLSTTSIRHINTYNDIMEIMRGDIVSKKSELSELDESEVEIELEDLVDTCIETTVCTIDSNLQKYIIMEK